MVSFQRCPMLLQVMVMTWNGRILQSLVGKNYERTKLQVQMSSVKEVRFTSLSKKV